MTKEALHTRLNSFKRKVDKTIEVIGHALLQCSAPYVACSFGKDSAVMLHLVLQCKPDIPVRFMRWNYESDLLHDYERVIGEWRERTELNLQILEMERGHLDERCPDRWHSLEAESDGYFIGFRAEESRGRAITLKTHGQIYRMKSGLLRIAPLAWWSTLDVAAYAVAHNLPMLSAYATEGWETRTTARVPRDQYGIRSQSLALLKRRSLASFNALCERFPEVRDYV